MLLNALPKVHKQNDNKFDRIIDANFNRAKEGLRVCEDVCRFCLDAKGPTRGFKNSRHQLTKIIGSLNIFDVIRARNIAGDVGRKSNALESKRNGHMDIFYANSQRVKESIRVLEEFTKLRNKRLAQDLKKLRYKVYALEKTIIERR